MALNYFKKWEKTTKAFLVLITLSLIIIPVKSRKQFLKGIFFYQIRKLTLLSKKNLLLLLHKKLPLHMMFELS